MVAISKTIDIFVRFRDNLRQFRQTMFMSHQAVRKFEDRFGGLNQSMIKNASVAQRLGLATRALITGFRGFRMEMLGILFFGIAMQKFFLGLLSPSLNLVGVFEVLNTTLAVTFLPTALEVLDVVINLFDFMTSLPEPVRAFAGEISLLGIGLGTVIGALGALSLGLSSIVNLLAQGDFSNFMSGLTGVGTQTKNANNGMVLLGKTIGKLTGSIIALAVVYDLFGRGEKPLDTKTFIKDLGLATIAGYLLASVPGALAAFSVVFAFDVLQSSVDGVRRAIRNFTDDPALMDPMQAVYGRGYQGTSVPSYAQESRRDFTPGPATDADIIARAIQDINISLFIDPEAFAREQLNATYRVQ